MRILKDSRLLKKARGKMEESADEAEEYAKSPGRLSSLISDARHKLMQLDGRRYNLRNFISHISVFSRILRDRSAGVYPKFPWKSLLSIVGSLLYFLNPLDVIPDFIPFIGYLDDVTLMAWVYRSIESDVNTYLAWARGGDSDDDEDED